MGSRREEERNEKIIRGLMKLPPNRKCINCNSLGPQYVCTNFWTFVCMTCSGIHREFTHRVKSVSMSKFTSQEVEALQSGGNQRAKEIYFKIWDFQSQRLPSSSNIDKVREFIKSVYVDRRYAGGNTSDKPPRDVQTDRNFDDERKRASSYHSYSQSPPYDYQYEYHRNGKPVATLSRKPGSDKGYVGRISSFFRSPRRSNELSEDKFANEGSSSRHSDYSVSSGGDQLRSDRESPNCQDTGYGSPSLPSRDVSVRDIRQHTVRRPQRTASSGSFASFDSNSVSLKSYNSANLADLLSESEQPAGNNQDRMSMFQQVSATKTSASSNLYKTPEISSNNSSAAMSVHSSKPATLTQTPSLNLFQPEAGPSSPMDLFAEFGQQQPTAPSSKELLASSILKNEGWATFDPPQPAGSVPVVENSHPASIISSNPDTSAKVDSSWSTKGGLPWLPYQGPEVHDLSPSSTNPWTDKLPNTHLVATNTQSWSTFEEPLENPYSEGPKQSYYPPWNAFDESTEGPALNHTGQGSNPPAEEITKDAQSVPVYDQPSHPSFPLELTIQADLVNPLGEICSHAADKKSINPFDLPSDSDFYTTSMPHSIDGLSLNPPVETRLLADDHEQTPTNPFDVPFDSDMEKSNMFLNMSSMQATLPDAKLPPFVGGDSQAWFHQNSLSPYIPDGGLAFMASQAPGPQLH